MSKSVQHWDWGFQPRANGELKEAERTYGTRFASAIRRWVAGAAHMAAAEKELDGGMLPPGVPDTLQGVRLFRLSLGWCGCQQDEREGFWAKTRDLLFFLRHRQPPVELWVAENEMFSIAESFDYRVTAWIEVHRTKMQVRVLKFIDLPGQ